MIIQPLVSEALAIKAAWNYWTMRSQGFTARKTIDLLIGTFCIEGGHRLRHDDHDFDPMETVPGLAVLH